MRNKRTNKPVKRPDLSALKEAMRDQRQWAVLCKVLPADDGGQHWTVDDGDVLVDVQVQPSEEELTVIVSSPVGGLGTGVFAIPPVDSEVYVSIPDGEISFQPSIVGVNNSGPGVEGLGATTLVIVAPVGGEVLIHDGSAGYEPLIRKSDYDALAMHLDAHTHPTGVGPSGPPIAPTPVAPGTSVLKGK